MDRVHFPKALLSMSDADSEVKNVEESVVERQRSEILNRQKSLPYVVQRRVEVLLRLKTIEGSRQYAEEKEKGAQELGISVRSLERLVCRYRKSGVEGLMRQSRSDASGVRVSKKWQTFILETYRKGNRGTRSTSRSDVAKLVVLEAERLKQKSYPSRSTVYRLLQSEIDDQELKTKTRDVGWYGDVLKLTTKEGIEIAVEYSNQVWQCDHTPADILVVDQHGEILGRPTLTTVVDTYSRCIVGFHFGIGYPSSLVTALALRHAIMPKQYSSAYELSMLWETFGVPQYLYTDAGRDFTSHHLAHIAEDLGVVLCLRRRPSDGGIVERPFGTFNTEFFSSLPGYTTSELKPHKAKVEAEACLTLREVERLFVRYLVDRYNQLPDPRTGGQSRLERWKSGRIAQPDLIHERDLDLLLMRKERRRVYRNGYVKFMNLVYEGEYLAGYEGQEVVIRFDPRDITTLLIYRQDGDRDVFLTRAYARNLLTEALSLAEAKAISRRLRESSTVITNNVVLRELRDRTRYVEQAIQSKSLIPPKDSSDTSSASIEDVSDESGIDPDSLPDLPVYDYDELRQQRGI